MATIREYAASVATYSSWQAETEYILGAFVEPSSPNGKCYEATQAGTSGLTEPRWPTHVDETIEDGEVIWTCREKAAAPSALSVEIDTEGHGGMGLLEIWVKSDGDVTYTIEGSHTGEDGDWRWIQELNLPYKARTDRHIGYFNAYRFVKVSTESVQQNEIEVVAGEA